jgi:hypothetical protein
LLLPLLLLPLLLLPLLRLLLSAAASCCGAADGGVLGSHSSNTTPSRDGSSVLSVLRRKKDRCS